MDGNIWSRLSAGGGVQSGSMGVVIEVGEVGGVSVEERVQLRVKLAPKRRHRIIKQVNRYFMFILFMANSIVAHGRAVAK